MDKEKNKKIVVKREMRTNSENEPSRVYRPRTLKAHPVSDSDNNPENIGQTEDHDSSTYKSEKSKEGFSKEKPSKRDEFISVDFREKKKIYKKPEDSSSERKSTYKPRTGGFKKSNEEFSSDIEFSNEETSIAKESETTPKKVLRIQKTEEKPFRKKDDRFDSDKRDTRSTSRNIEGKSTGYRTSRVDKSNDRPRESREEREERFRRQRAEGDIKPRFNDRAGDSKKPYGSRSETPKKQQLRLYIPEKREKIFIDKPIPKPKREYDDKPFLEVDSDGLIRLNKFIANTGLCSRREADDFIENGMITINGEVITQLGTKVDPNSEICFKGKKLETEHKVYILLNKPKDYITTVEDPNAKRTVMELIEGACTERVYPVGRLDRNSTGLLLLTNDGEMTKRLTHPSFQKKKIYQVGLDRVLVREDMEKLLSGVKIEGELIKADAVEYIEESDGSEVGIEIHTGQNRVVRNMFDVLGYKVSRLDRVYFAGLTKKNLPRGSWRFLTQKEINMLKMNRFD
ncbi:MAG: rRNA pseudouridine synthase [Bacteroidales bacterium]|nr:rRNA pseudouridine synthase [Bacteroidales bacterium]